MTAALDDTNAAQRDFWNGASGQQWVACAADLELMTRAATDVLLERCAPRPGERILDIGCGAGATSFAFAASVGPRGEVAGFDISAPLLGLAEERRRATGLANVRFTAGDAETDALPDRHFDAAISRFGAMFFADPVAAFRNIARALRPGGRLVLVAWAGPERNPWFTIPRAVATARLGDVPPTPPDAPGPMAFRDIVRVVGLLRDAGLADPSGEGRAIDLHHPGGAHAVAALATRIGPAASVLRQTESDEAEAAAIAADLVERFAGFAGPDGIRIPAEINLFRATAR